MPRSATIGLRALLLASFGIVAVAIPLEAQTRDTPASAPGIAKGDGQTTPGNKGPVIGFPVPSGPTGANAPGSNGGPASPADGLPDAVTVLEILRHLPQRPGLSSKSNTIEPPGLLPSGPRPLGGPSTPASASQRPPDRVVGLDTLQPFAPRPSPRSIATPSAITGAVVANIRPREVIVTLAANATTNAVFELSQDLGLDGDTLYTSNLLGTRVVRFRIPDTRSIAEVVQQLSLDARVQLAQPDYVFTASQTASKPMTVPQYAPQKLHLAEAHKLAQGNRIKIAIIDTAIDQAHPALGGAIMATFDALGETRPEAELHGTSIASIVSARAELTGVAPQASILSVRAFSAAATGSAQSYSLAILKGLDWAVLNGARVVNMSFAGPNDPLLGQAIAAAVKLGVVVVAAAGNGGPDAEPAYPGAYPNVIAVTAIDSKDVVYKSANRGTYIAVAAPGVDIMGAAPKAAYEMSSGTSMAAAHVSGIVALMLEKNSKQTPKDVRDALSKSAHQPPRLIAEDMGAGIVDAADALGAVK